MNYDTKSILKISLPIIVSMIFVQLINITDVVYLGRLSTIALGAAGLGSTYFFAFFMLISGFSFGAQIIMSRRNGEQNTKDIGPVLSQGTVFLVFCSFVLIVLSYITAPVLFRAIISDKAILKATLEYTNFRIFGLVTSSFLMMFRAFFVSLTKTFVLQIASLAMIVSNIVLNYMLIFGFWFIPPLGIKGAAIASVISEGVAVLTYLIYFAIKVDAQKYALNTMVYRNFKLLKNILDLSVWTMLQQFASVGSWFLFFIAIEHLGTEELAISNILKNSAGIPWIIIVALGATAGTVTGNLIGENRLNDVLRANKQIIRINTVVIASILVLFAVFYYPILRIYTDNILLIKKAVPAYMSALLCYLPLFSGWILFQAVSATGNTRYTMFIELVSMVFYMLFIAVFILWLKIPLYIAMFADGIYNLVVWYMSKRFMLSNKWRGKKF